MKFSLVAALVVVLAIAHGTQSVSVVKREVPPELEKITNYFKNLAETLRSADGPELAAKAKAYFEETRTQLEPIVEKFREQMAPLGSIDEQIKPLVDSVQAQLIPYTELMQSQTEQILKYVMEQSKAILPPSSQ